MTYSSGVYCCVCMVKMCCYTASLMSYHCCYTIYVLFYYLLYTIQDIPATLYVQQYVVTQQYYIVVVHSTTSLCYLGNGIFMVLKHSRRKQQDNTTCSLFEEGHCASSILSLCRDILEPRTRSQQLSVLFEKKDIPTSSPPPFQKGEEKS